MVIEWHAIVTADEIKIVEYEIEILWDFTFPSCPKPYGLIEPIYPYVTIPFDHDSTYYWWMTPVENTGDVIIQS